MSGHETPATVALREDIDALYRQCAAAPGKDGPLNLFLLCGEDVRQAIRRSPALERYVAERYMSDCLVRLGLLSADTIPLVGSEPRRVNSRPAGMARAPRTARRALQPDWPASARG